MLCRGPDQQSSTNLSLVLKKKKILCCSSTKLSDFWLVFFITLNFCEGLPEVNRNTREPLWGWLQTSLGLLWEWPKLLFFLSSLFWLLVPFLLLVPWLTRGIYVFLILGPHYHKFICVQAVCFLFLVMVVKYNLLDLQNQLFKNSNKKILKTPIWSVRCSASSSPTFWSGVICKSWFSFKNCVV